MCICGSQRTKEGAPVVGARRRDVICFTLTKDITPWSNNFLLYSLVNITFVFTIQRARSLAPVKLYSSKLTLLSNKINKTYITERFEYAVTLFII